MEAALQRRPFRRGTRRFARRRGLHDHRCNGRHSARVHDRSRLVRPHRHSRAAIPGSVCEGPRRLWAGAVRRCGRPGASRAAVDRPQDRRRLPQRRCGAQRAVARPSELSHGLQLARDVLLFRRRDAGADPQLPQRRQPAAGTGATPAARVRDSGRARRRTRWCPRGCSAC